MTSLVFILVDNESVIMLRRTLRVMKRMRKDCNFFFTTLHRKIQPSLEQKLCYIFVGVYTCPYGRLNVQMGTCV